MADLKGIRKETFWNIYKILWIINNNVYTLKKEILKDMEDAKARHHINETIKNFIKQTRSCTRVVNLYVNSTNPKDRELNIMNLWEYVIWIKSRTVYNRYYSQQKMLGIMLQLISTLSFLRKYHITKVLKPLYNLNLKSNL